MPALHNSVVNGNGKLTYWLLGLFGTFLTGGAMAWLTNTNGMIRAHGERIAVLESQMIDQRDSLKEINRKLDRILEQKGK